MEDYHADAGANASSCRSWTAFKSAMGAGALLAALVLSVGGIEVARADSPQPDASRFIMLDGKPIGTAVSAEAGSCRAGVPSRVRAESVAANIQRLVHQTLQNSREAAAAGENLPVALNSRGYNYGAPVAMSRLGR